METTTDKQIIDEAISTGRVLLATNGRILRDPELTSNQIWLTINSYNQLRAAAEKQKLDDMAMWVRLSLRYLHQELNRRIKLESLRMQ